MKRLIALLCVIPLTAALLVGCSQRMSELKNDTATMASEVGDELDDMISEGTVRDGDGFIDEDKYMDDDRSRADMTRGSEYVTEATVYDDSLLGDDNSPSDASEFI